MTIRLGRSVRSTTSEHLIHERDGEFVTPQRRVRAPRGPVNRPLVEALSRERSIDRSMRRESTTR